MRLRETFELLKRRLEDEPFLDYLGEGIFITGGCSQLNGIDNLAEDVFGIPARVAHARSMSGLTSAFENPQFSAAIGLIKYAQAVQGDRRPNRGFRRIFGKIFNGIRS
jgi:cell division protein FtsA